MNIFIKSLVFQIYFYCSVLIAAVFVCILSPLPYAFRFKVAQFWAYSMLYFGKKICGLNYEITGTNNIPNEPCVIMIKHTTVFEAYAQLIIFPPQTWVIKRELLWIPIVGWALLSLNCIAINRKNGRQAVNQVIQKGTKRLKRNIWITIFPEGTRMPPGTTRRYGISGAALAENAKVNIIPVAHNAGDFWPRRSLKKQAGTIKIIIGKPIKPINENPKLTNLIVQEWIESKMHVISKNYK